RHVAGAVLAARLRRRSRRPRHLRTDRPRGAGQAPRARRRKAPVILEARDIRHLYGDFCALDGVTLLVEPGQFVAIIGPNGAGKSTLINVLTGLLTPSAGTVRFKGRDIRGAGPGRLARLGLARSFQLVQIFPELTVLETLQAAAV